MRIKRFIHANPRRIFRNVNSGVGNHSRRHGETADYIKRIMDEDE